MRTFSLSFRGTPPRGAIDGSTLQPDAICARTLVEVCESRIRCGNEAYEIGDLFEVTESPSSPAPQLRIEGSTSFCGLGAGMSEARLIVDGPAGDCVARDMRGGEIEVHGSVGSFAGAGMLGGVLRVHGDAGDDLGGPPPGASHGMNRGEILVKGSVGARAGFKMRRGLIYVGGSAGRDLAAHMLAGTILVAEGSPERIAFGMKRGTIVALGTRQPAAPASFREDGVTRAVFLRLLWRRLEELGVQLDDLNTLDASLFRSFSGDLSIGGRGEILYRAS